MTFSFDLSNSIGKVRLLIPDTVEADAFFSDEWLTTLLDLSSASVTRTAAAALGILASDEAYVSKKVSLAGALAIDGPAVSAQLLARAKLLLAEADAEDAAAADADVDGLLDWAEMVTGPFSRRERLDAESLRGAG